jgi:ABC-type transport system involved in cytochrome bd biosynthesis fused ATPase/permease subunit
MLDTIIGKVKANAKKIEILLLVVSVVFLILIIAPLVSRYEVKKEQKKTIEEAIDYMRAFRTAYASGARNIQFKGKDYQLVNGTVYESKKFRAIDHKPKCIVKLKTNFVDGVPLFLFNEIAPDCWGYIREAGQLREFTRLSLDSKLEN